MKRRLLLGGMAMVLVAGAAGADSGAPVVSLTNADSLTLEQRVDKLEQQLSGQALKDILDILQTQQELQQAISNLRGQIDVLNNDVKTLDRRQREGYLDIDRRLRQLESAASSAPSTPTAAVPAAVPAPPDPDQASYQQAFDQLKDGRYDEAISAFRAQLTQYPNGKYADNAQYWIGEAYYVTRRYQNSIDEFSKILSAHPDSAKFPDALCKIGFSYYELGDWDKARANLEQVVAKFPQSNAAHLADERLQEMKAEGH